MLIAKLGTNAVRMIVFRLKFVVQLFMNVKSKIYI